MNNARKFTTNEIELEEHAKSGKPIFAGDQEGGYWLYVSEKRLDNDDIYEATKGALPNKELLDALAAIETMPDEIAKLALFDLRIRQPLIRGAVGRLANAGLLNL